MKINKIYLENEIKTQMSDVFDQEAFISLNGFFKDIKIKEIDEKYFDKVYEPLRFKFEKFDITKCFDKEILEIYEFFRSREFIKYVESILDFDLQIKSINLVKLGKSDYTLLNDIDQTKDQIFIIYDITSKWEEEFGGTLIFTTKEEEILYLAPSYNQLSIFYKPEEVMKYTKYINNKAKKNAILRFEIELEIIDENLIEN